MDNITELISVVQDERGVTHVAIRFPDDADNIHGDTPGGRVVSAAYRDGPVIGALCEDTIDNLFLGSFTIWSVDEINEGLPDCMSCLVREGRPGLAQGVS